MSSTTSGPDVQLESALPTVREGRGDHLHIALLGNPNTGKTTLFNRLCGLRAKTANYPGSTTEVRVGICKASPSSGTPVAGRTSFAEIIDHPGLYSLNLNLPEAQISRRTLAGQGHTEVDAPPDIVIVVADATNLARNLQLIGEVAAYRRPIVVALNMIDIAQRRGLRFDLAKLVQRLGCPVVPICARSGDGLDQLLDAMASTAASGPAAYASPPGLTLVPGTPSPEIHTWAADVVHQCVSGTQSGIRESERLTDRLDSLFTHPIAGTATFLAVQAILFGSLFYLASIPMDLIDLTFSQIGGWVENVLPEGPIRDLLSDGVIGGIAGTLVFLPQILFLFFLLSLLEDTGYLARAAFVMDRFLRRFGLPGQAFVPLVSSHACAIPGIMGTRLIPDRADRIATILVAPFMSCSARVPVYVLLTTILFPDRPFWAGVAFVGCYLLGAVAAMLTALLFRRTILRGASRPMVLELPSYKRPSLRTAFLTAYDRAVVFLKNAGTNIMAICIVMWWLSAYPTSTPPAESIALREQAARLQSADRDRAADLTAQADRLELQNAQANSYAGRIGRFVEPVFEPLGYDWRLTVGVMTSFLAREVFVSTMTVITGSGDDADDPSVLSRLENATRDDGAPLFAPAASASLLVFYVLAMQCLPTLAVTRRETGSIRWALLQLAYMSLLAYVLAFVTHFALRAAGVP